MLRLQQTLLGLVVYTLVIVLVWPTIALASLATVGQSLNNAVERVVGR